MADVRSHRQPRRPRPWHTVDWISVGDWALILAAAAVVLATFSAYYATAAY